MPLSSQCPHCGAKLRLKDPGLAGKKVQCPGCKEPFTVKPLNDGAASGSAPAAVKKPQPTASKPGSRSASKPAAKSGGEDDWMSELDSLIEESAPEKTAAASAPQVAGKRRKKPSGAGKRRQQSRWRDVDGDLHMWVQYLWMITLGLAFGFGGMAVWAGLTKIMLGVPLHWVAVFVGVFIGTGVRLGASKWDFGWGPALTASIITFFAIVVGKVVAINALSEDVERQATQAVEHFAVMREHFGPFARHENYEIKKVADDIALEWEEAGREVDWPDETGPSYAWDPSDYAFEAQLGTAPDPKAYFDAEKLPGRVPEELWKAASERWQALPDEEKQRRRAATEEEIRFYASMTDVTAVDPSRPRGRKVFGIFDIICLVLGIAAAFRIAAGFASEEEAGLR